MAKESNANRYEDARQQRLLDNKKRFEDLGLLQLSKNLSDLKKSEPRSQQRRVRPKTTNNMLIEPRRSSRARNPVTSYRDDVLVDHLPHLRKRSRSNSSWASYLARPIEEVKTATYEERAQAYKCAEKLESNLKSGNPAFVKSMVRSHVYSCFWLGLPSKFCEDHLPKSTVDMVLENENGSEYDAVFISKRTGLSGGWRAFALEHKLDDGDALVFELVEPTRFKVYIVRAFDCQNQDIAEVGDDDDDDQEANKKVKKGKKNKNNQSESSVESKKDNSAAVATRRSLRKK